MSVKSGATSSLPEKLPVGLASLTDADRSYGGMIR